MTGHLFIFGYGYTAARLGPRLVARKWRVSGTHRSGDASGDGGSGDGVERRVFDGRSRHEAAGAAVREATHVLVSIPPDDTGDPVLRHHREDLEAAGDLAWIGLFSSTGVYGDRDGAWVDETTDPRPGTDRARRRVGAEAAWSSLADALDLPLQIFRLSSIYGPERSPLDRVRGAGARRIVKPGSVFNRVHVDDIVGAVEAGIARPDVGGPINVTDARPASSHEVLTAAARIQGIEPPPEVPFDEAGLSPMGRTFYAEDRRVAPTRLTEDLGYRLRYPTYEEGLKALLDAGD